MKVYYSPFSMRKRGLAFLLAILIVFAALFLRLFDLTIISGSSLQAIASEQWMRGLPLAASRGEIYDTNGNLLATNETTYDIYIRARNIDDPALVAQTLSELLDKDYSALYDKCTNIQISESLVTMQVSYDISMEIISKNLSGVYLSQNVSRIYPYGDTLTQVLGYTTIDNVGQAGVEDYYNKFLAGVDGVSLSQTDAQGAELDDSLRYYIPSIDGMDVTLEIDIEMQLILEKYLQIAFEENEAAGASGVIIDAKTGGILAMSNKESFDLNDPPRDDLDMLADLTKNKNVVDVYEPGSTFKIFTLFAALNEGLTTLDETFCCCGNCSVDGEKISCWKTVGHGTQTLAEAFKNSCNVVFVELAERLGVEKMYQYMELFGIGEKTGVDISGESSGIVLDESLVKLVDLVRIGFGQTVAVTPIQMVTGVAKALTGTDVTPHLMKSVSNNTNTLTNDMYFNDIEIKQSTIDTMCELLGTNLNGFDDKYTYIEGYDVGGKTGTAQKYENGAIAEGKYVASFLGVYPASDPEIIMLITIDEPSTGVYYGGLVASPVGKSIFTEIFAAKSIQPDNPDDATLTPDITLPNMVGMSISNASALLATYGIESKISGSGGIVVSQLPASGTLIYSSDNVLLMT